MMIPVDCSDTLNYYYSEIWSSSKAWCLRSLPMFTWFTNRYAFPLHENTFNFSISSCIHLHSGVSRLQKLMGPIVSCGQTFLDTCQNHASIKGSGKCKYLALSTNYHILSLKVTYLYSHLLLVWFWVIFRFFQIVQAFIKLLTALVSPACRCLYCKQ